MKAEGTKHERIARKTFCDENDARKVWEVCQSKEKLIKYDDHVLMITLASDNSPIRNLPDICLREIFYRLDTAEDEFRVEIVCKRWRNNGRCCWSNITKIESIEWEVSTWKVILSRVANSVEDVKVSLNERVADGVLGAIVDHCVHLKRLRCEYLNMNYEVCASEITTIIQQNRDLRGIQFYMYGFVNNADINFMEVLPAELVEIDITTIIMRSAFSILL